MTKAHEGMTLPIKTCLPIDWQNTVFLAHYDLSLNDSLKDIAPIGTPVATLLPGLGKFGGGVAVEEGTTNLVPNINGRPQSLNPSGTTQPTVELVTDSTNPFGTESWKVTFPANSNTGYSGCLVTSDNWTMKYDGTTYSYFVWLKGDMENIFVYHTGTRGMPSLSPTGRKVGLWQEYKCEGFSYTDSAGAYPSGNGSEYLAIFPQTSVAEDRVFYVAASQVEEKSFCTSFIEGSRSDGLLEYPEDVVDFNQGTFSCWAKTFTKWTSRYIFKQWDTTGATNSHFALYMMSGGEIRFEYGPENITSSGTYQDDEWHHYAIVWEDGTTNRHLYVDGELVGSATQSIAMQNTNGRKHGTLPIGHRGWTYRNLFWNGIIDELRIDKVARTEEEIQTWYHSQAPFFPKGVHKQYL